MEDRSRRPPAPSILWPGIILAAVGLYGYLTFKPKLETSRPKPSAPIDDAEPGARLPSHYARLWEDPLGQKYRNYRKKLTTPDHKRNGDGTRAGSDVSPLPRELLAGSPLILPVLLDGAPDIETTETRMRTRYAVVAALTTAKYRPAAPKKMQYVKHFCGTSGHTELIVPIEVFVPDTSDPVYDPDDPAYFSRVLVCWLDEDEVEDAPLHTAASLARAHTSNRSAGGLWQTLVAQLGLRVTRAPRIHVIGPASSDGLINMAKEEMTFRKSSASTLQLTVFSPRATVEPAILKGDFPTEGLGKADVLRFMFREEPGRKFLPLALLDDLLHIVRVPNQGARFVSVVGTDWHLACALRDELKLRDAWPQRDNVNECVVLVTEKDTLYGRAIPNLFSAIANPAPYRKLKWDHLRDGVAEYSVELKEPTWQLKLKLSQDSAPLNGKRQGFEATGEVNGKGVRVLGQPHALHRPFDVLDPSDPFDFWEVQYGREGSWRHARLRVTKRPDSDTGQRQVAWRHCEPIVVYKYLRGMDGLETSETPRDDKGNQDEARKSERAAGYQPAGNSQLDYLRRVEQQLTALHHRQRGNGGRGILAIGVVGSDIYDKLLVLRALRKRFPKATFFTTDLDANYSRLTELEYTRNLIVASHFGLRLHPSLQRDVPPFRRSYQTATFLAVLWAVYDDRVSDVLGPAWSEDSNRPNRLWPRPNDAQGGVWENIYRGPQYGQFQTRPLVFEIGLQGPYQLTMTNGSLPSCPAHVIPWLPAPVRSEENGDGRQSSDSITAQLQPPSPREIPKTTHSRVAWGIAGVSALGVLIALHLSAARRFFRLIGQSLWNVPFRMIFHLHRPWASRTTDVAVLAAVLSFVWLTMASMSNHRAIGGEPFEWFQGVSVWPSTLLRLALAILSLGCVFAGKRELDTNLKQHWTEWAGVPNPVRAHVRHRVPTRRFVETMRGFDYPGVIRRICTSDFWYGRIKTIRANWRKVRLVDWDPSNGSREEVLRDYGFKGSLSARSARIIPAIILYLIAASALFFVTDGVPNFPARGLFARATGKVVLALSVGGLAILVFFVVDAIHLCQRFVIAVGKQSEAQLARQGTGAGQTTPHPTDCLNTVRMLAERTNVVSKLLIYPFTALLLMILSRNTLFDNWDFPWSLAVLPIGLFLLLVIYALVLRRDAHGAREDILRQLRAGLLTEADDSTKNLVEQIERVNRGAFRPLTDDYVFRALAIPFGGTGGLVLIEQLLPSVL